MAQNSKLKLSIWEKFGSQRKFAKKIGIHEVTLSNIISGAMEPSDEQKELIAGGLKEKWDNLITE